MGLLKRITLYSIIILFLVSIYKDITMDDQPPIVEEEITVHTRKDFHVLKREIHHGDTILSIMEEINDTHQLEEIHIEQMMIDFKMLNKNVNPYQLQQGEYYLFPKYFNEHHEKSSLQ